MPSLKEPELSKGVGAYRERSLMVAACGRWIVRWQGVVMRSLFVEQAIIVLRVRWPSILCPE